MSLPTYSIYFIQDVIDGSDVFLFYIQFRFIKKNLNRLSKNFFYKLGKIVVFHKISFLTNWKNVSEDLNIRIVAVYVFELKVVEHRETSMGIAYKFIAFKCS